MTIGEKQALTSTAFQLADLLKVTHRRGLSHEYMVRLLENAAGLTPEHCRFSTDVLMEYILEGVQ